MYRGREAAAGTVHAWTVPRPPPLLLYIVSAASSNCLGFVDWSLALLLYSLSSCSARSTTTLSSEPHLSIRNYFLLAISDCLFIVLLLVLRLHTGIDLRRQVDRSSSKVDNNHGVGSAIACFEPCEFVARIVRVERLLPNDLITKINSCIHRRSTQERDK